MPAIARKTRRADPSGLPPVAEEHVDETPGAEQGYAEIEELAGTEPAGEFTLKGFAKPISAFSIVDMRPRV